MAQPYAFIGGPADGRTISLVSAPSIVRFFDFKVEDTAQGQIANPDEVRVQRYLYTVLPDVNVYFYRLDDIPYPEACRRYVERFGLTP